MNELSPGEILRPSFIDRLMGTRGGVDVTGSRRVGIEDIRFQVLNDLEKLLNTKKILPCDIDGCEEVQKSLLAYGRPDLSGFPRSGDLERRRIKDLLEEAIALFEPRLENVEVDLGNAGDASRPGTEARPSRDSAASIFQAEFQIRAMLHVEPIHETVSFKAIMEKDTGSIEVKVVS